MKVSLVIPIKQLENAKQRLASLLDIEQRGQLFRAMVEDVLEAASTCERIDEIIVVTSDKIVAELAMSYGAIVHAEPENPGLIAAVTATAEYLSEQQVDVMVFLPGDVPLVSVEELEVVLGGIGFSDKPEFLIVPASDLGGSNCVVCSPPDCVAFGFGEDSYRRHLKLARERNIEPSVARLPGIGLDVDTPEDLHRLVEELTRENLNNHTHRFLAASGLLTLLLKEESTTAISNQ